MWTNGRSSTPSGTRPHEAPQAAAAARVLAVNWKASGPCPVRPIRVLQLGCEFSLAGFNPIPRHCALQLLRLTRTPIRHLSIRPAHGILIPNEKDLLWRRK